MPVSGLQHLETTVIYLLLANKPVKIVALNLSSITTLIESDFTECLKGGLSFLMEDEINAKHITEILG
jgi:hypothetical protein